MPSFFRGSTKAAPTIREEIGLLVNDQHYYYQPPISTVTFFEGSLSRERLTERVQKVLSANPWLGGRLTGEPGKLRLAIPEEAAIGDHLFFTRNEKLRPDQPLATLDTLAEPMLVPIGDASLAVPLFVVTAVEAASARFALVISMSHVIADGHTYYSIYGQLSDAAADGADAPATALVAKRDDDFGMMLRCALKARSEWPLHPHGTPAASEPLPRGVWRFREEWLAAEKQRAVAEAAAAAGGEAGGEAVAFVSTNDVICSWIFSRGAYDVGIVSANLRGRMSGLKAAHAGNYECATNCHRLPLIATDCSGFKATHAGNYECAT